MPRLCTPLLFRAVVPTVAVLAGMGLYAAEPLAGFFVAGALLLAGLVWAFLGGERSTPPEPLPELVPAGESLTRSPHLLRLLESAVVHAHDAVVILEAQPRIGPGRAVLYVNDAFCTLSGYVREEVLGRSLHFLRGPGSDAAVLATLRQALTAGTSLRVELQNYRKDGTPFWVDLSLVPVPDAAGRAAHWVMIQRDITDRKAAEEELQRREALFRGIFENTSAGMSLTDGSGKFVSCNPAFAAMIGRTVAEVLGLTPEAVTHPDDWAAQVPLMDEVRAGTRDRFSCSKRYVHVDGQTVWTELSFAAVRGPGGELEWGVGVSLNVTERRRLEEQLRHIQKIEALGQMAGGVAHDFNNLLTGILCNLPQIRLPDGDPNRGHLATIEQAATRAAELTGKLLGYARRNQLVSTPIYPADAFGEVVGLLRHALDPRIRLVVHGADDCDPVQADPTLLSQVLLNLCLNARDAMPEGGTLTLTATRAEVSDDDAARSPGDARAGQFIRLSVTDTGCGMPDAVQARLFEPFFTTKGVGKGTGLGLPMVQGIVKQHRGWITFASAPGAGTRFDVYLPPADSATQPARPAHDLIRTPPPTLTSTEAITQPDSGITDKRTILLVDDEAMIRDIGRLVLERAGFRVRTAEDGFAAVEVFRREPGLFDLVILDVTMPRMSGRDAYRHLMEFDPTVKVLFSTGYSAEDLVELDGTAGLLGKPYRPHELLAAVQAALAGHPAPTG